MTFLPLPYSSLLTVCESLRVVRTEFTLFFPFFFFWLRPSLPRAGPFPSRCGLWPAAVSEQPFAAN
jgi:hypothetical protein